MRASSLQVGLLALLVLAIPFGAWAEVTTSFSPLGGCDRAVASLARSARSSLDAACYAITLDTIAGELIAARQRGVQVRVITDKGQAVQKDSQVSRLVTAGVKVKVNTHSGLMRHSFLITDEKSVATGSFDWTTQAKTQNDGSLVVFKGEPSVALAFSQEFARMWSDPLRFVDYRPAWSTVPAPIPPEPDGTIAPEPQPQPQPPSAECQPAPGPRTDVPGNTVYITKSGSKYHRAGCSSLRKSSIPISRSEAEARGYTPCANCSP